MSGPYRIKMPHRHVPGESEGLHRDEWLQSDKNKGEPAVFVSLDSARIRGESAARERMGPLSAGYSEFSWRLLNDGLKPGNIEVWQLYHGQTATSWMIHGTVASTS